MSGSSSLVPTFPVAFPDPIFELDMVSGACFLYFREPILFTLLPTVSLVFVDPFKLVELVRQRNPQWADNFFTVFNLWRRQHESYSKTAEVLGPLHGQGYKTIRVVYPRGSSAMKESSMLLESSKLQLDDIYQTIDPVCASGELVGHLLFEMYLEKVHKEKDTDAIRRMSTDYYQALLTRGPTYLDQKADLEPLFEYCESLFTQESLASLLVKSYMFRMPMLKGYRTMLLTNQRLVTFLSSLPVEYTGDAPSPKYIDDDVIAWELFRELLSPKLDPLDERRVALICELRESRKEEVEHLRLKCQTLAEELRETGTQDVMSDVVTTFIRRHVEREISELLRLDKTALENFFESLFSDEKTWLFIVSLIGGMLSGTPYLTAGATVAALCSVGAKAFKAAAERKRKLRESDYALIYRISQKV